MFFIVGNHWGFQRYQRTKRRPGYQQRFRGLFPVRSVSFVLKDPSVRQTASKWVIYLVQVLLPVFWFPAIRTKLKRWNQKNIHYTSNYTHRTSFIVEKLSLSLYHPQMKSSWKDSPSFLHVLLNRFESGLLVVQFSFLASPPWWPTLS